MNPYLIAFFAIIFIMIILGGFFIFNLSKEK
jgi:uncharacterized protein YpmB